MKSTILLTTALFLASAPAPDSQTISEVSGGFLSTGTNHGLMAAELSTDVQLVEDNGSQITVSATQEQLQLN